MVVVTFPGHETTRGIGLYGLTDVLTNIDMYLSLSALSGEVVPLHVVDVICVMLCSGA